MVGSFFLSHTRVGISKEINYFKDKYNYKSRSANSKNLVSKHN